MGDLIIGLACVGFSYYQGHSMFMGQGEGYYYIFDAVGVLMILSGIYKLIRGTKMDDR